MIQIRFTD